MSDFEGKMHQIRFLLWLCLRCRCGRLPRSKDPCLYLRDYFWGEEKGKSFFAHISVKIGFI